MYINVIFLIFVAVVSNKAKGMVVDLGHGFRNHTTTCWNPSEHFASFGVKSGMGPNGWYSTASFSTSEHCGTHLDAPFHFYQDGWKLEDIPLNRMIAEGVHLNVSHEVNGNGDFLLTADHFKSWELVNGPLPRRSVILVNFGWAHKFGNRQQYYYNGVEPTSFSFPGLSEDAARWIVDSGKVYGLGVDGPSVDPGNTNSFNVHRILSKANLYNLENVALNGTALPSKGFKLVIQPMKIVGGTGGPCRILAFTNNAFE